jgi:hypothetical protein
MASEDNGDSLGPARPLLVTAIRLGTRVADAGDSVGCYGLLACAARLARKVKGLGEVADFRLERALDDAEHAGNAEEQVEELQSVLDGLVSEDEEEAGPAIIAEPLAAMQTYIGMAISIGAPAYNTGDHQGCFDVYSATARMVLATIPKGPDEARTKLQAALDACNKLEDPNEQAWAMRHAFDAIGEMGDGPPLSIREVQLYLSLAIRLGAPAFNAGDHRGCYETYACAARFLVNAGGTPEELKSVLRAALEAASIELNVTRQAWVMREAFDSLLPQDDDDDDEPDGEQPEEEETA